MQSTKILITIILILLFFLKSQHIYASGSNEIDNKQIIKTIIMGSGHPVPRFLSIKSNDVHMRKGPGTEYPITWKYIKKGYPLKVVAEFHNWRKVIDYDNETGWIRGNLLSGKRFVRIIKAMIKLKKLDNKESKTVSYAERNVLMELHFCKNNWCKISSKKIVGWTERENLWGVLENEKFN